MVYKYRCINQNTLKDLNDESIWLSPAEDFNDPFDFYPRIEYFGNPEFWKTFVRNRRTISTDQNDEMIRRIDENPEPTKNLVIDKITERTLRKVFRICCFSSTYDELLMWSHYSDSHCGICIGYKTELFKGKEYIEIKDKLNIPNYIDNGKKYLQLRRVEYSNKLPPIFNPLKPNSELIQRYFFIKYKKWCYEKEKRIISIENINHSLHLGQNTIQDIYFGCNCVEENIKKIIRIFIDKNRESKVSFYKMRKDRNKYMLRAEKIV